MKADMGLNAEEIGEIRDIIAWWRMRERTLSVLPDVIQTSSKRSVRSFRIEDDVYSALRTLAEEQGRSVSVLVGEALRWYLTAGEGQNTLKQVQGQ